MVNNVPRMPVAVGSAPLAEHFVRMEVRAPVTAAPMRRVAGEVRLEAVRPITVVQRAAGAVPGSRTWSPPD